MAARYGPEIVEEEEETDSDESSMIEQSYDGFIGTLKPAAHAYLGQVLDWDNHRGRDINTIAIVWENIYLFGDSKKWKANHGPNATYDKLLREVIDEKNETKARSICEVLNKRAEKDEEYEKYVKQLRTGAPALLEKIVDWDNNIHEDISNIIMSYAKDGNCVRELLNLTESEIVEIFGDVYEDYRAAAKWKENEGSNATYKTLLLTCCIVSANNAAKEICAILNLRVEVMEEYEKRRSKLTSTACLTELVDWDNDEERDLITICEEIARLDYMEFFMDRFTLREWNKIKDHKHYYDNIARYSTLWKQYRGDYATYENLMLTLLKKEKEYEQKKRMELAEKAHKMADLICDIINWNAESGKVLVPSIDSSLVTEKSNGGFRSKIGYRDYLSRLPEAAHLLLKKEFDSENDLHAHLKLRKEFDSKNDLCAITKSMGEADWDKETVFRPFLVQLPAKPRNYTKILYLWKRRQPPEYSATYLKLLQTCCLADIPSAAEKICNLLKFRVQSELLTIKPQQHQAQDDQDVSKSREREEKVVLHVADVGQGTAMLIECQKTKDESKFFLYYGGVPDKLSDKLLKVIEEKSRNVLSGIVVSHPDANHAAGIVKLLEKHPQTCPVVLTTAFSGLQLKHPVKSLLQYVDEGISLSKEELHRAFHHSLYLHFHEAAPGVLHKLKRKKVVEKKCKSKKLSSETSIILQIKQTEEAIDICLTGDAVGGRIVNHVKNKKMHAFLVPHHGNKSNSVLYSNDLLEINKLAHLLSCHTIFGGILKTPDLFYKLIGASNFHTFIWRSSLNKEQQFKELYEGFEKVQSIMTADEKKMWNDLPQIGRNLFNQDERFVIEKKTLNVMKTMEKEDKRGLMNAFEAVLAQTKKLWQDSLHTMRCKWFYDHVQASTYIIPCGSNPYGYPSKEVINGIALAAAERNEECQIVLTDSTGLEERHLFSDVFFDHKDVVSLWYLDSDEKTKPSCLTIDPLVKPFDVDPENMPYDRHNKYMKKLIFNSRPSDFYKCLMYFNTSRIHQILKAAKKEKQPAIGNSDLTTYLESIGHKGSITLSSLLDSILGSSVLSQLNSKASLETLNWNLLCNWQVKKESAFFLSATGVAVISGEIHLQVPNNDPVVKEKKITTAVIHVDKPRTKELQLDIQFDAEKEKRSLIPQDLDLKSSCGLPPAEYLAAIGIDSKSCTSKLSGATVGELLALVCGSTKATALVSSFTHFFSTHLIKYPIDPIQTLIDFQNSKVAEAILISSVPKSSRISVTKSLHLEVQRALLHLFPSHDKTEQLVGISGDVTMKEHHLTMKASPKFHDIPEMEFAFTDPITISEMFELFGVKYMFPICVPFTQQKLLVESKQSAGFTIQQPYLLASQVSSIFFDVEWFASFPPFWPECVKAIKKGSLSLTLIFPLESRIKIGVKASFSCELVQQPITLDCSFAATPILSQESQYSCSFSLRPSQKPYEKLESMQGAPVLDLITSLNENVGKCLSTVFSDLGQKLLQAIELREIGLQLLSTGTLKGFKLDVGLTHLDLIAEKLALSNARLLFNYSPSSIHLECEGEITCLQKYKTFISFLLPTSDSPGELKFENNNTDFTLEEFVRGMLEMGDSLSSVPLLSDLLSISIDSIHIVFLYKESKMIITHASVILTKKELSLGLLMISNIEIDVSFDSTDSGYTWDFSISGFIGHKMFAKLQYHTLEPEISKPPISMLKGDIMLANFQNSDGVSALNELKVNHEHFSSLNPLLDGADDVIAQLNVEIEISQNPVKFDLVHVALNLTNALEFNKFAIKELRFEYAKSPIDGKTYKFFGSLGKLDTGESAALELTCDKTAITAKILSGDTSTTSKGLLKLSSLLDLVQSEKPDIPQLTSSTKFFDLELKSGSISFKPQQPINVSAFDVHVMSHGELCLIDEPRIAVSDVMLEVVWKEDCKVKGNISAIFHFSKKSIKMMCEKAGSDILLIAKMESEEMSTNTEIEHICQNKQFSELVPPTLFSSQATPLAVAANVTRKQFLFISNFKLGSGVLFVGNTAGKLGLALAISLHDGFQFKQLSGKLSFVDDLITIKKANLTVSLLPDIKIAEFLDDISKLMEKFDYEGPFANFPVSSSSSDQQFLTRGVAIIAEMDIKQAEDSLLQNIIKIQSKDDEETPVTDLLLKASLQKRNSSDGYDISIKACLHELTLFKLFQFKNIQLSYELREKERKLELSGTLHFDFNSTSYNFDGSLAIADSNAMFKVEHQPETSGEPFASPLGMDITLTELSLYVDFDMKSRRLPISVLKGSINFAKMIDLHAMLMLKGLIPKLVVIDAKFNLSLSSLITSFGASIPNTLIDFKLIHGHFHYAGEKTEVKEWMLRSGGKTEATEATEVPAAPGGVCEYGQVRRLDDGSVVYEEGIHIQCRVQILCKFFIFDICLDITKSFTSFEISGSAAKKIELPFVSITDQKFIGGPKISFKFSPSSPGKFMIEAGLEILGSPLFFGSLWYDPKLPCLNGTFGCHKDFLWVKNPTVEFRILPEPPFFLITDFKFGEDNSSLFDLAGMLEKFCVWLLNLVEKVFKQSFDLHLKTIENPDTSEYSVAFSILGTYKVVFFDSEDATVTIKLPELIIKVRKGFTLTQVPGMIIEALAEAGLKIVNKIVGFIMSNGIFGSLKKLAQKAVEAAQKVIKAVCVGVKAIGSAASSVAKSVDSAVENVANTITNFFSCFFGSIKIQNAAKEDIAEIMGGTGGRKMLNEKPVARLFGPLLGIYGIYRHGKHIYKSGRAAANLPDGHAEFEGMGMLEYDDSLDTDLEKLAFIMLEIQNIEIEKNRHGILVNWDMDPTVKKVDDGDFDYHVTVVAFMTPSSVPGDRVSQTLFDGLFYPDTAAASYTCAISGNTVPPHAYLITVSVQASITMNVRAHGITEDVTVEGKWRHAESYWKTEVSMEPPSVTSVNYDPLQQQITGTLSTTSEAEAYIVQLVDADSHSKVADHIVLQQQSLPPYQLKFTFDILQLQKSIFKGIRAITVRAQSIGNSNAVSEFALFEKRFDCLLSPKNVRLLTDVDINVRWKKHPESSQAQSFSLHLQARLIGSGKTNDIIMKSVDAGDSVSTSYSHSFKISEIAEALQRTKTESPGASIALQCRAVANGNKDALPSIPAYSDEVYILPPPTSLQCFYNQMKKSLHIRWALFSHAFSYKVQLVNNATNEVALSKDHDSCECVLGHDALKKVITSSNATYRVQVFTLGHGKDYLGSLQSCVATTLLHTPTEEEMEDGTLFIQDDDASLYPVQSLKMQYTPGEMLNSICLAWKPPEFGADTYTVSVGGNKMVTSATEIYLSPLDLGVYSAGKYAVSVAPDGDTQPESTLFLQAHEVITNIRVEKQTATSMSVHYDYILPDAPEQMNYYLIVEAASSKHIPLSLPLDLPPNLNSAEVVLHHIYPETEYNLYALAFTQDCKKWAIPQATKTATLPAPKEVHLLGQNLLDDASGSDMTMGAYTCKQMGSTSVVQDSWAVERWTPKSKCDPPPLGLPTMYRTTKDTSIMRTQMINFLQQGFSPDEYRPEIRIQSWVCAPAITDSPTYYKMVVKLLSKDKGELSTVQKGPLKLFPTGKWRAVEISVSDYSPLVEYIEYADYGSSENDNITRVTGTTIRLGRPSGSSMEVFSLPHHDSATSKYRTCLVHVNQPEAHTHFHMWLIEFSKADSKGHQPQEYYAPIAAAKDTHDISLTIDTVAVHMKVFGIGKGSVKQKIGEAVLPSMDTPHIFERNLLTSEDLLQPWVPIRGVEMDELTPSRVWADLEQKVQVLASCSEEVQPGFDPPPFQSNFAIEYPPESEDTQRTVKIDLWALGFSPRYIAQNQPKFLVQIQYIDETQMSMPDSAGGSNNWKKFSTYMRPRAKEAERHLIISLKNRRFVKAHIEVEPCLRAAGAPMIYIAILQSHEVKLQYLDAAMIADVIRQKSPSLLVERRVLQDLGNHGDWYEHYFGSPSNEDEILVSNLKPSTVYEFAVTLTDTERQEKYFCATTSGCTLPAHISI